MSENVVARLRERIAELNCDKSLEMHVRIGTLATLLDIVEAMADQDNPYTVAVLGSDGDRRCEWCGGWRELGRKHRTPDCPYRRARELCGKDGAE